MIGTLVLALAAVAAPGTGAAVEWGLVDWSRSFDETAAAARKSGKPILLLFDEVPG